MIKRSDFCEFDKKTRDYIKERDNGRCIICGGYGEQIMHIFLNRSHGGRGCKENGALGCIKCHTILDNPIGQEQNDLSKKYKMICESYLIYKEHLKDRFKSKYDFINYLKYKK